jgi:putative ABC transport system permease protein
MSGGRHLEELDDEIRDHLERETQDNIDRGMTPEAAYYAARRKFGNVAIAKEDARAVWIPVWIDQLQQDARYGVRMLRRSAGVSAVVIATLAVGIGANSAIFSVIRAVLLKPPSYADADRLVLLNEKRPDTGISNAIAAPNYLDWLHENTVFEQMAGVSYASVTLSGRNEPVYVPGLRVSASYFDVFGLSAILGRTFGPDEDQAAKAHVVVLSHRLWASQFGSDPAIIGNPVRLDGELHTVIGVMPSGTSVDLTNAQLWKPLTVGADAPRSFHDLFWAVAKLKAGVTLNEARSQMDAIGARLADAYPESNKGWGVLVQPLPRPIGQDFEPSLYLLFASVGTVLLIGCANLANLALARGRVREREMAVRAALGAGRGRLARQVLTENLVVGVSGGLFGLVVGYGSLEAMKAAIPSTGPHAAVPPETIIAMDAPVWLFALALSILSGIAFGLAPALGSTRPVLTRSIKAGSDPGAKAGRAHRRFRQTLIVAEVALAFVLLTSAGLLIQSFFAMQRIDTGFESTNVLTAKLPIPETRFENATALNRYLDQITGRIQTLPGIRDVAFTDALPTQGGGVFGRFFQIADRPIVDYINRPVCGFKIVSPSYFRTVGLRILKGRALSDRDREGTPFVIVINETMAQTYFQGVDPVGKRILMRRISLGADRTGSEVVWEVVGVIADERLSPFGAQVADAIVYATHEQNPTRFPALVVRTTLDPVRLQEPIRRAVYEFDRDQPLADVKPLNDLKADYFASDRLRSVLLGIFASIAVTLAGMGLYGVISYVVVQRTHEMGIRAALGASAGHLVALVVREGMVMTGWGLAVGFLSALAVTRMLTPFLFGLRPSDPTTMTAVAALLAGVALIACYIPARRATSVDPSIALRSE